MPPCDLWRDFEKLLETGEESDVKFRVQGEVFRAHRIVLAVRSPVLKAELYGPVGKDNTQVITVEDMEPAIFRALLRFVYTGPVPFSVEDRDGDANIDMVKHLLVAADRYAIDRLKLVCEDTLCKHVDADSVVSMLLLADQLHCRSLKDACFKYMGSSNRVDVAGRKSLAKKKSWFSCLLRLLCS